MRSSPLLQVHSFFEGTPISFNYSVDAGVYDLDEEISMTVGLIIEDFESGNFNMLDWYFSGDADWSITESDVYEGNYCAKSGDISNNSITSIMIDVILSREGDICFWKKVSTEVNYDYLRFLLMELCKMNGVVRSDGLRKYFQYLPAIIHLNGYMKKIIL